MRQDDTVFDRNERHLRRFLITGNLEFPGVLVLSGPRKSRYSFVLRTDLPSASLLVALSRGPGRLRSVTFSTVSLDWTKSSFRPALIPYPAVIDLYSVIWFPADRWNTSSHSPSSQQSLR